MNFSKNNKREYSLEDEKRDTPEEMNPTKADASSDNESKGRSCDNAAEDASSKEVGNTPDEKCSVCDKPRDWNKLIIYDQFSRTRNTGKIIYKGEDAYPYLGENLFFVADGLGGTGGSVHSKFDPDLFEEDRIVSKAFDGIFPGVTMDEDFCAYVKRSFRELFSIKDCYHENRMNMKHSAYFGSRFVSAIVIQMMKEHKEIFAPDKLFAKLENEQERDALMREIELLCADYIKTNLMKIVENVGLEHESDAARANFKLMATSLCAAIYIEKDDCVEVLYMNAGDSRAYMWNVNGLYQVVNDQESPDGGMTNFIYAEPEGKFTIECNYRSFKKPCILFNSTDGCFDALPFAAHDDTISGLAFEKYILDTVASSESLKEAGDTMGKFFMDDRNRNDDSSTMALQVFGYASLDQLKADINTRLERIQADYLDGFEDLFLDNYIRRVSDAAAKAITKNKALKQSCKEDPAIISYCEGKIGAAASEKYKAALNNIAEKENALYQEIKKTRDVLYDIFVRNLDYWIETLSLDSSRVKPGALEKQYTRRTLISVFEEITAPAVTEADRCSKYDLFFDRIKTQLLGLVNGDGKTKDKLGELKDIQEGVDAFFNFIKPVITKRSDVDKLLCGERNRYFDGNKAIARGLKLALADSFSKFLSDMLELTDFERLDIFAEDKTALCIATEKYKLQLGEKDGIDAEKKALSVQEAKRYCEFEFISVAEYAATEGIADIDKELEESLKTLWSSYKEAVVGIVDKAERQRMLGESYSREHFKYIPSEEQI